ncbi:bacteriocin-like protein [Chryseobacterium vietnamense]|uniref:bacteriocin n=1 Tax=Chryseobacterium vietnamense TaxID=866785 RepID=UPI002861ED79|nr:bacteriocin [Chryseobacterium vietnamense]MDR6487275.1 bacteriocin-like protein [Chryseobacterium vietnamense]
MKIKLEKFEFKTLDIKSLSTIKGGDSNCGTAETKSSGADSDSDTEDGGSDSDSGGSTLEPGTSLG